MKLVDLTPEASALRDAVGNGANDLHDLSLEAGGLAGLLQLISASERLSEQERMALGTLADIAQHIENEIEAVASRLGEALEVN